MRHFLSAVLTAGLCLMAAAGCSNAAPLKLIPTTGKVVYKGMPVADATVTFESVKPGGRSASGTTAADGTFKLQTLVSPGQRSDGALPGDYRVTVMKVEKIAVTSVPFSALKGLDPEKEKAKLKDAPQTNEFKSLIPEMYASPKSSNLKATVSAADHEFTFELTDAEADH